MSNVYRIVNPVINNIIDNELDIIKKYNVGFFNSYIVSSNADINPAVIQD